MWPVRVASSSGPPRLSEMSSFKFSKGSIAELYMQRFSIGIRPSPIIRLSMLLLKDGPDACHQGDWCKQEARNGGQEHRTSQIDQDRIEPLRPRKRGLQNHEDGGDGKYAHRANHQQPHATRSAPERQLVRGFAATCLVVGTPAHQHLPGESRFGTSYAGSR